MKEKQMTSEEIATENEDLGYGSLFMSTLKNRYADFMGKSTRRELWTFLIIGNIIILITAIVPPVSAIISLILFIPIIALWTRRIRDAGLAGWWAWIFIITIIPLIFIAFTPTDYFKSISQKIGGKIDESLSSNSKSKNSIASLKDAHTLLEKGAISQLEFDKIKKSVLG